VRAQRGQPAQDLILIPVLSRLVGEAALKADVACRPVIGGDDSHRDAAGRADRRAVVVVGVALVRLLHKSSLVGAHWAMTGRCRRRSVIVRVASSTSALMDERAISVHGIVLPSRWPTFWEEIGRAKTVLAW
jgi:hypothetical protein